MSIIASRFVSRVLLTSAATPKWRMIYFFNKLPQIRDASHSNGALIHLCSDLFS